MIIEGFKPHNEALLAVDDISFSKEQCEKKASKYNGGAPMLVIRRGKKEKHLI